MDWKNYFSKFMTIKCKKCSTPSIIYQPYSGLHLCEKHFFEDLERKAKLTLRQRYPIRKNDVIAVALSGGKDSSVALLLMHKIFGNRPDIKIIAVTIDEGIAGYRNESIERAKEMTARLGIEHIVRSFSDEYGKTMDAIASEKRLLENHLGDEKKELGACSYCGVLRKKILNKVARDIGATKLVIGHNLDDEAQTIMLNHFRGDVERMVRFSAASELNGFIVRAKPLRKIPEKEVALYAYLHDLPMELTSCPHSFGALRKEVRRMLNGFEVNHPGTKYSLVRGFDNMVPLLASGLAVSDLQNCEICGEPCNDSVCQACKMLEKNVLQS
ncbi:tRNA-5-methyluridine(54) 2-sulfurtransferase [Methanolapillus ohkumae]|uniref:tRNA-5-methyluridine(54) 2-sulfurtransferase n=2 Tax=Methanolapillus ohkumae TaxID=3028298 RepID=A0AA96ZVE5_9EURY|nr:tRNA-5-methyluridine(54) 2-sulfurtransferase [Methanosarcinaceae archaeon Am2]